ncbi:MAG: hypothetical protein DRG30_04015 [Epsilonproteobacteria bacterium]|nr:MAG: hypothetical protein DRG30_04015 [Campylobacterota bacterium]
MKNIEAGLAEILELNGALAASLFDWQSGMVLGMASNSNFDIELASAGNADVVRTKMATMKSLNLHGKIQDIMIALTEQIHIIHVLESNPELCLYVALDSSKSNLALARSKLNTVAKG